ncbi:hypothetical protein D5F11_020155 [Siminovitchia terrae]|uniref:Uncharacterized protein n=1 Tax=Siminovitchia terrae TaxID=1914933 RepID=A0A429X3J2_SIMTE|nr:hypothetical protein [Siminovitchia terrae]RST57941.1 hypothetical protein D5F11_020155 [Siminovitchia terrae]
MNAYWYSIQWGFKPRLNKVKPPADATDFQRKFIELKLDKIWAQIRQGAFDSLFIFFFYKNNSNVVFLSLLLFGVYLNHIKDISPTFIQEQTKPVSFPLSPSCVPLGCISCRFLRCA